MIRTISAAEMRERLLAGLQRPSPFTEDWVTVLASEKNRTLLGIIGRLEPQSIGELADLVGRAQPNVSRSLSSLSAAGLIEVTSSGRRSIPVLTEMGREKAQELGLLDSIPATEALASEDAWLRLRFDDVVTASDSLFPQEAALPGNLFVDLWFRGASEPTTCKWAGDLTVPALQLVTNWWRLLYRRDAPRKLIDVNIESRNQSGALSVRSSGHRVQLMSRAIDGAALELDKRYQHFSISQFETDILNSWLQPIAKRQRSIGGIDSVLQSSLARLRDSREDLHERTFCRTAGALGVSPYELDDGRADALRRLIEEIPEEDARLDFASAVLWEELDEGIGWAEKEVNEHSKRNSFQSLVQLRCEMTVGLEEKASRPWAIGCDLARQVRRSLHISSDQAIGGMPGLTDKLGVRDFGTSTAAPGAVRGYQSASSEGPVIVVEDEGQISTTFILARAVGDYLAFGSASSCVANLYTDRQAVGRAFAAELIAPAEAVVAMVEEGNPSYKIERHFGASPEVIRRQYENYGRSAGRNLAI